MARTPDPLRERQARHPRFLTAVAADASFAAANRGEPHEGWSRAETVQHVLRLLWQADAFPALVAYRLRARCQARGIPVVPRLLHRFCMARFQVCIGDPVVIEPGVYLAHGQVVIDGLTEVGRGTVFFPWVTVGLRGGNFFGPTIGRNVKVGSGAKIVGAVQVGDGVRIGANAVVVSDVAPRTTVVGVPARPVGT